MNEQIYIMCVKADKCLLKLPSLDKIKLKLEMYETVRDEW